MWCPGQPATTGYTPLPCLLADEDAGHLGWIYSLRSRSSAYRPTAGVAVGPSLAATPVVTFATLA
jgi:hypothetical protein